MTQVNSAITLDDYNRVVRERDDLKEENDMLKADKGIISFLYEFLNEQINILILKCGSLMNCVLIILPSKCGILLRWSCHHWISFLGLCPLYHVTKCQQGYHNHQLYRQPRVRLCLAECNYWNCVSDTI